ncbi:MAG TPA: hypothetical protein VFQ41_18245 [Candidatus Angelobacter sp.]|nr:hypothetical protein [Candidatus Angelobacter sp.]
MAIEMADTCREFDKIRVHPRSSAVKLDSVLQNIQQNSSYMG